jgi:hypothetical protein
MASNFTQSRGIIPGAPAPASGVTGILNQAIPGLPGLQTQASERIRQLMAGQLSPNTQANIQNAAAQQAVASGMPGASRIGGSLHGNRVLRDIGLTTEGAQQQGFGDLLQLLGTQGSIAGTTNAQNQQASQFAADNQFRNTQLQTQDALARAQMALEGRKNLWGKGGYRINGTFQTPGQNYGGSMGVSQNLPTLPASSYWN